AYIEHEVRAGLPPEEAPAEVKAYRDTAVKLLATHSAGLVFGADAGRIIGIVLASIFSALLLSAVNTAIMAMVSVIYSLGHDGELPKRLTRLNYSGVPKIGLALAVAMPIGVLLFEADPKALGELYAIGVVGAIAINVVSCAANKALPIKRWERAGLWTLGGLMAVIEVTIVIAKPNATAFAGGIIAAVLMVRYGMRFVHGPPPSPATEAMRQQWLEALERPAEPIRPDQPRIMLAARGRGQ